MRRVRDLQKRNKLPHSEFPLSEVSDNFRPDPFPNRNRDTIPDHPVRIVRAADESKCVWHTLEARVFSDCVRSHAFWKSSIDDQSGAQVFRVMRNAGFLLGKFRSCSGGKKLLNSFSQRSRLARLAFPNNQDVPAFTLECPKITAIAFDVRESFSSPEFCVRRRHNTPVSASVHVKKTAVHIDDLAMSNEYDVRFSGKVLLVKSKSKT